MKKRIFPLLLALCVALSLCACGDNASGEDPAPASNADVNVGVVGSAGEYPPNNSDPVNAPNSDTTETEVGEQTGEDANAPAAEVVTTLPEGLIIMTTTDSGMRNPKISCIDPVTGESQVIAEFNFAPKTLQDTVYYFPARQLFCNCRNWFSADYSKVAVSRSDEHNQSCAGWIDTDGNFFNVSEALGQLNRGDFDDPVQYYAAGFSDDGYYYIYRQVDGAGISTPISYHYVPIDNLTASAIQDGLPFAGIDYDPPADLSDYIDGSRYLINTSDGVSKIFDVVTEETMTYVPGTSRLSWNGVVSPDGSQVAFMSQPKNDITKDIYVMPLAGGDPVKVVTDGFKLSSQQDCKNGRGPDGQCTMLIDWR